MGERHGRKAPVWARDLDGRPRWGRGHGRTRMDTRRSCTVEPVTAGFCDPPCTPEEDGAGTGAMNR